MPARPLKPCRHQGCRVLSRNGNGFCDAHHEDAAAWANKKKDSSGRGGRAWRRLRLQVLERDGWLCQCDQCRAAGRTLVAHEVDHISNARDENGDLDDDPRNLRAINRDCHKLKTQAESAQARRARSAFGQILRKK